MLPNMKSDLKTNSVESCVNLFSKASNLTWLIFGCWKSRSKYFMYIQDENKCNNIKKYYAESMLDRKNEVIDNIDGRW